ncbi:hypothetical protein V5O48_012501 [Marasmius crinis-equi]|uniref:Adhesin domain-containing protein n=1 Tax=Marasmius crinis-equi TaxID=585013 RepID=A0ABR3F388_9AGAR
MNAKTNRITSKNPHPVSFAKKSETKGRGGTNYYYFGRFYDDICYWIKLQSSNGTNTTAPARINQIAKLYGVEMWLGVALMERREMMSDEEAEIVSMRVLLNDALSGAFTTVISTLETLVGTLSTSGITVSRSASRRFSRFFLFPIITAVRLPVHLHPSLPPDHGTGIGQDGGFAPYVVVDDKQLLEVPEGVSAPAAAVASDAGITTHHAIHETAGSKKGRRHPHHHHCHHKIRFDVNVRLPPSSDKQLKIKKLVAWLPVFARNFDDLGKNVRFDTIASYGSVSAIHVESLSAKNATVVAAVGGIKGNFTASSHLELVTASGEIDANVGLINDEESDEWTNLVLKTAVSTTRANISLSTASSGEGGKFNITLTTHSGHVTLDTLTAPPKSTVDLSVAGSVGSIDVAVHKTFEGRFDALTSVISKPTIVEPKEKEEDGKERKVDYEQVGRGVARGSVWWRGMMGIRVGRIGVL